MSKDCRGADHEHCNRDAVDVSSKAMSTVPWNASNDSQRWIEQYLNALVADRVEVCRARPRDGLLALLADFGNPQQQLYCVRVAGSKGKGSTALMLEAILQQAGYRVGVFTSPHINHWCERIRLQGHPASEHELAAVLAELAPRVTAWRAANDRQGPGFFEVLLAAALVLFARAGLDIVIVECGIGAATDATAVVPAALAILTTVEAEHLTLIGPTLVDVAREKAGVIEAGRPAIIGRLPDQAMAPMHHRAAEQQAMLHCLGRDFDMVRCHDSIRGRQLRWQHQGRRLSFPAAPAPYWLADNVALAVAAAERIRGKPLDEPTMAAALGRLQLPGRLEQLAHQPVMIADSAHTHASATLLARYLATLPARPSVLVVAFSTGHDPQDLPAMLWQQVDYIVVTRADERRGLAVEAMAESLDATGYRPWRLVDSPVRALDMARQTAGHQGLICTAGSVYMAACMRRWWQAMELSVDP